jgi:DNA polymerase-3 subunit beta
MYFSLLKLKQFLAYRKGIKNFDRHSTIPILEDIRFRHVGGDAVELTLGNLETFITTRIAATEIPEGVSFCINAKQLSDMIKNTKGDLIHIDIADGGAKINMSASTITHDAESYPRLPIMKAGAIRFTLSSLQLTNIVDYLSYAANDDLRPSMNGVCIRNKPNELSIIATDANKLIVNRYEPLCPHAFDVILPKDIINTIKAIGADSGASFTVTNNIVFVKVNGVNILGKPIEQKFPEYENIIPKDNPIVAKVNKVLLIDIIKQCEAAVQVVNGLHLHFNGALKVSSENLDLGTSFAADIPYEKIAVDEDFEIGVNPKIFLSAIKCAPNDLILEMSTPSRPFRIDHDNQSIIVMPIMINN